MFSLFKKRTSEHLILFTVTTSNVAGAYVEITPNQPPRFFYIKHVELAKTTTDAEREHALTEALTTLTQALAQEGAPLHQRATHTGHMDGELMCIGYPWQKTTIHTKTFNRGESFIFTEEMREYALTEITPAEGYTLTGRFLLATLLNGYQIGNPIGKKVKRADLLMMSASVDEKILESITKVARRSLHAGTPRITTFAPIVYFVMQDLYPHEEEALIMNISRNMTDIAVVKKRLLVDVMDIPVGTEVCTEQLQKTGDFISKNLITETIEANPEEQRWIDAVAKAFTECSSRQALPRTIFLLADERTYPIFKRLLDSKTIRALWLLDTKLTIIPLEGKHVSSLVRMEGEVEQDLYLSLLALFYSKHKELVP